MAAVPQITTPLDRFACHPLFDANTVPLIGGHASEALQALARYASSCGTIQENGEHGARILDAIPLLPNAVDPENPIQDLYLLVKTAVRSSPAFRKDHVTRLLSSNRFTDQTLGSIFEKAALENDLPTLVEIRDLKKLEDLTHYYRAFVGACKEGHIDILKALLPGMTETDELKKYYSNNCWCMGVRSAVKNGQKKVIAFLYEVEVLSSISNQRLSVSLNSALLNSHIEIASTLLKCLQQENRIKHTAPVAVDLLCGLLIGKVISHQEEPLKSQTLSLFKTFLETLVSAEVVGRISDIKARELLALSETTEDLELQEIIQTVCETREKRLAENS